MSQAVDVFNYVNLVAFAALGALAAWQWRQTRLPASAWAALAFADLGVVVLIGRLLPDQPHNDVQLVLSKLVVAALVVFPYFLYRFTTAFRAPSAALYRYVAVMTVALIVATFALPKFPGPGDPRPGWFIAYLIVFVVHWTVLSIAVAGRLWRAGRDQPGVARRRMTLFSLASATLTVAIFFAAAGSSTHSAVSLATAMLAFVSAIGFMLALNPPGAVRVLWRRGEQKRLNDAIGKLMRATSESEVANYVLPPLARLVAAARVRLCDADGNEIAEHVVPDVGGRSAAETEPLQVEFPGGRLVVSASSYAPFFGNDELRLLHTLGSMAGLALDRTRLFAAEQQARTELERANELQKNFVALAAHELRTPFANVHGISETLERHRADLPPEQVDHLEKTLFRQMDRLRLLVNQLLDLSRLEAAAIPIDRRRIAIRPRVEEIVGTIAPRADLVEIDVDPSLEADADPEVLDRVVSNLIANALRYGDPPVIVRAEQRDRHFRVSVEDRGEGVPDEFVPTLFERFTRSSVTRARGEGSGLGLAIARAYAQAHGGDLVYEPAEPHGARFELVLPAPRRD